MKFLRCLILIIATSFTIVSNASINDYIYRDFNTPSYSNYGSLGLIQMPNARFHKAGTLAFSWSHNKPYINGSIVAYPFSWLEASYFYTDINNALYSDNPDFSGNQSYKDKGFDVKFRLFSESNFIPQIAVGARDWAGSATFSSEYIVASRRIKNVDISIGMGWGTLSGNRIKNPFVYIDDSFKSRNEILSDTQGGEVSFDRLFSGQAGLFGGVEIALPNSNGTRLKIEYDGTDYKKEGFPFGRESFKFAYKPVKQPDSKLNFGFTYPVNKHFHLKLSYTKGNTINFGFSLAADFGSKSFVRKKDPIIAVQYSDIVKDVNSRQDLYFYRSSLNKLRDNEIYLQSADISNEKYSITYTQSKHISHLRALGRATEILNQVAPDNIKNFELINLNAGLPLLKANVVRESFDKYRNDNLYPLAKRDIKLSSVKIEDYENHKYQPRSIYPKTFWGFTPSIRSQIGGPDGFFLGDLRFQGYFETLFAKNFNLVGSASVGIVSNLNKIKITSDSIMPHVRTDIVEYLQESEEVGIDRLQFNIFNSHSKNFYSKISFGLLEEMFGGYGGEFIYRPFNKNYAIGAELWHLKQREYDMLFKFRDYETVSGLINLNYHHPQSNILISIRGGRFLAKDSGISVDFSRVFKTGLRIGAFASKTDISKLEFGEGSFDKGFYFFIPIEVFYNSHSKRYINWGLRPLTRDGAAFLNHAYFLWGVTEQGQNISHARNWDDIYD
jgi:hypothetical protein